MSWIFKLVVFIWPFIKELVLGDATVKQAVVNNKFKLFFAGLIVFMIALNLFLVPRIFVLSRDYLELEGKYNKLLEANASNASIKDSTPESSDSIPVAQTPTSVATVQPVKPKNPVSNQKHSSASDQSTQRYNNWSRALNDMRREEHSEK